MVCLDEGASLSTTGYGKQPGHKDGKSVIFLQQRSTNTERDQKNVFPRTDIYQRILHISADETRYITDDHCINTRANIIILSCRTNESLQIQRQDSIWMTERFLFTTWWRESLQNDTHGAAPISTRMRKRRFCGLSWEAVGVHIRYYSAARPQIHVYAFRLQFWRSVHGQIRWQHSAISIIAGT